MKLKQTGPLAPRTKPWQLIRDAIHDLTLQEKCRSVVVNMSLWHTSAVGKCHQCLAGVVMSRQLGIDTNSWTVPEDFPEAITSRLHALNAFRLGCVRQAYIFLGVRLPPGVPGTVSIPGYRDNPSEFKRALLALADQLEAAHRAEEER